MAMAGAARPWQTLSMRLGRRVVLIATPLPAAAAMKPRPHLIWRDHTVVIPVEPREQLEHGRGIFRQRQLAVAVLVEALEHAVVHHRKALGQVGDELRLVHGRSATARGL